MPGAGDGQGGLACCSPWGRKESDMTEQLNRTEGFPGVLQPLPLQALPHPHPPPDVLWAVGEAPAPTLPDPTARLPLPPPPAAPGSQPGPLV